MDLPTPNYLYTFSSTASISPLFISFMLLLLRVGLKKGKIEIGKRSIERQKEKGGERERVRGREQSTEEKEGRATVSSCGTLNLQTLIHR
ncbi:hypothetical protein CDL15_Pgr009996 [Punica granatum]|uniref:Uncharacterized protein n=1 Tax=Punica granatum TaxID=22663 RepID=A0A218X5E2_PUNGR|nr:hypothetical protein CDL15_Pgr009996 [Punica granatum]